MGVFDDKKFEQLDWMSQITETIDSEVNGLLARLPERLELNYDSITSFMESSYRGLSLTPGSVVRLLLRSVPDKPSLSWEDQRLVESCFELECSDELEIDFENKKLTGYVHLVKMVQTIADEDLQNAMGSKGIQQLSRINWNEAPTSRIHDIMELLGGLENDIKGRSYRRKFDATRRRLIKIFKDNEWRIRDMALADKVGFWIASYISTGNLAAYSNFCKLKVMTHQNMPIYSIEESE